MRLPIALPSPALVRACYVVLAVATLVQSLSHVRLFVTSWTATHQASLSITNSRNLLKFLSIESLMPSNHFILCCSFSSRLQSVPASGSFLVSPLFPSDGQSIGTWTSATILPMNIQYWFPLGLTGLILQSKDFQEPSPPPHFKSINSLALSLLYGPTLTSTHDYWKNHSF